MDAAIQSKVNTWLNGNFDQATKDEIVILQKENPNELADAFYRKLEFGTGGLRGIMVVGTNRMNKYTVGMATQGYANYLRQSFPGQEVRVAIAHDSRNNSRFFVETTANVFAANGIKVFLFEALRPTPFRGPPDRPFPLRKARSASASQSEGRIPPHRPRHAPAPRRPRGACRRPCVPVLRQARRCPP